MTSTERVWLTPRAHDRLQAELAALLTPATRTAPEDPATTGADSAVDNPLDDARRRAARVRVLQELLAGAVVGEDPPNDGVAEPGMVLTVRYDDTADDTADEETFLLGLRDAEQPGHDDRDDIEVYSPTSPLGMAVTGARPGDQRSYRVPNGATVRVTLLDAVPYGRHHTVSVTPTGPGRSGTPAPGRRSP